MYNDVPLLTHFITKVLSPDKGQQLFEVEIIVRRATASEPVIDAQSPRALETGRRASAYVYSFSTNLSEDNKRGLDNLTYWAAGPRKSKTYIINQALAQYLSQYKEAQQPVPSDEG
ncbi:hypothetical protein [Hymenobacter yonginensis]|uniref:Cytoplasmic protein n=1 Tax=Hymenobacter yonginensis TaxID=748197 RepID=A0ABY7PLW7_9BACT|nr:hypothetical protein [Hymenobacter yonginensis]WBO83617.1 hypothetical protein O9Z63_14670 [Hymenobacter yonginensis]